MQAPSWGATSMLLSALPSAGLLCIVKFTCSTEDRSDPDFARWFLTRRLVGLREENVELSLPARVVGSEGWGLELRFQSTNEVFV